MAEQMKNYDFPFSAFFIFCVAFLDGCLSMFKKSGFSCPPGCIYWLGDIFLEQTKKRVLVLLDKKYFSTSLLKTLLYCTVQY